MLRPFKPDTQKVIQMLPSPLQSLADTIAETYDFKRKTAFDVYADALSMQSDLSLTEKDEALTVVYDYVAELVPGEDKETPYSDSVVVSALAKLRLGSPFAATLSDQDCENLEYMIFRFADCGNVTAGKFLHRLQFLEALENGDAVCAHEKIVCCDEVEMELSSVPARQMVLEKYAAQFNPKIEM